MRGVFDEEELEELRPLPAPADRELTLGWGMLLAIFIGLVILCSVCFGLGYMAGHRGVKTVSAPDTTTPADREPLQPRGAVPKPSAMAQEAVAQPAAAAAAPDASTGAAPVVAAQESAPSAVSAAQAAAPQVHAALASVGNAAEPQQPASQVRPVFAPAATIMVQVAAVANPDDAEALVNALRKRSYAVTARHNPADNLIHVSVGPFATRAEADQWRMRLLNDGYNAVVQQ